MSQKYADIIIDISHEGVDKTFEYKIPDELSDVVQTGSVVNVPFGRWNKVQKGYVIEVKDIPEYDPEKLKEIIEIDEKSIEVEASLIRLAAWMKETYSCTMITALRTVMPVKEKVSARKPGVDIMESVPEFAPIEELNDQQRAVVDKFCDDYSSGRRDRYLLHGITGSGKTEVYIQLAKKVTDEGRAVIMLIPEIALTFQTVARFRAVFGDRISILNSRLSKGEKFREFERARTGETDIIIGPRSALFTPFERLGLIIIDEEHDNSYKSESTPKYHARETAFKRAEIEGAAVILGSATPSVTSYHMAETGKLTLMSLDKRAAGSSLPSVTIVDMRDELKKGNRSIISGPLYEKLSAAFSAGEQAMLFINRRGFNTFVSCRECGEVIKCPRCDVSLSLHGSSTLMCHYCGHTEVMPKACPKCKSKLIGGYGTGTEKVEAEVQRLFPGVKTIRMDKDTTKTKGSHGRIISAFRNHKADCLIGTQMIVKGHDFGNVTVVGAILADLGLFDSDYESSERTFDLLTQAAGRAGRADKKGYTVIQTYQPEHYAIMTAAEQNYEGFYQYETAYRRILRYPPFYRLTEVMVTSGDEDAALRAAEELAAELKKLYMKQYGEADKVKNSVDGSAGNSILSDDEALDDRASIRSSCKKGAVDIIGPAEAIIYKIDEVYRRVIYIKTDDEALVGEISKYLISKLGNYENVGIQVDMRR
ncbi:MAG: primosomal protein N' [Eubacterium sp.]|nr:primosomal protein N' [Eubacterium sp.]